MKLAAPTLSHWVGIGISVAAIVTTETLAAVHGGSLVLPAQIVTALIIASKVEGLLSVSINPDANARAALATGAVVPASIAQRPLIPTPVDSSTEVTQPDAGKLRKP